MIRADIETEVSAHRGEREAVRGDGQLPAPGVRGGYGQDLGSPTSLGSPSTTWSARISTASSSVCRTTRGASCRRPCSGLSTRAPAALSALFYREKRDPWAPTGPFPHQIPPVGGGTGRQLAAPAEVVGFPGEQIRRTACPGVEVGGEGRIVGVDGCQDAPPSRERSKIYCRLVKRHLAEGAGTAVTFSPEMPGPAGRYTPSGRSPQPGEAGAQGRRRCPCSLRPRPPLAAAVVEAGDARHGEEQGVDQGQMGRVLELWWHRAHVVVVHEAQGCSAPYRAHFGRNAAQL